MKIIIRTINLFAIISFAICFGIMVAVGEMSAPAGHVPIIVVVCTVITLVDVLWFIGRGLWLIFDETGL